jgi:CRP/FNR family transcriptional regulator, anaerobic regulatory protein
MSLRDDLSQGATMGTEGLDRLPRRMTVPVPPPKVVSFHLAQTHCPTCGVRELCLPAGLDEKATRELDQLFSNPRRLVRREVLYRPGEPFTALYGVRLGTIKTVLLAEDGREQITGYHMGGDVLGLNAIGKATHACEAIALEDSEVCALPFARLDELAHREPTLLRTLLHLVSRELRRGQELALLLGSMCADERLATFLLNLAQRNRTRGYSANELVLRMTREEIASFLGLKLETVSRVFSRLQGEGLIQVQGRAVKLLDRAGLERVAGQAC